MNDQNRPTCKVVTRPGQRGAKIHPKGCKVRNVAEGYENQANQGEVRKYSKRTGLMKPRKQSVTQYERKHRISLSLAGEDQTAEFTWDTGASLTVMNRDTARHMGILTGPIGFPPLGQTRDEWALNGFLSSRGLAQPPYGPVDHTMQWGNVSGATVADGASIRGLIILNVPLQIARTGEVVMGRVFLGDAAQTSNLLGVPEIRKVKSLKVKFRERPPAAPPASPPAMDDDTDTESQGSQGSGAGAGGRRRRQGNGDDLDAVPDLQRRPRKGKGRYRRRDRGGGKGGGSSSDRGGPRNV